MAWRAQAEALRRLAAADGAARALEHAAGDLERSLRAVTEAALTLEEAARESGYSADHLQRLIRAGRLPNAGRRGAPRLRRADVPRKAGASLAPLAPSPTGAQTSRTQIARSVVTSLRGERP